MLAKTTRMLQSSSRSRNDAVAFELGEHPEEHLLAIHHHFVEAEATRFA